MFYSQFILAKKGPLGTIWIAAHLERKLRKNQVADTDIGVSVDSILFPEMPIALRLSSHLLLGVVRIYSRKVNYLFDDCSEALLKVKQAFRSTTVDLPPEESTAPYHSITLPETFDLDDFELPDSEILHGNYVDHHISSKEQITLQDTMDGVVFSTSKFGLDETFGDGDASGLDLEEELMVEKAANVEHAAGTSNLDVDPQASGHANDPNDILNQPMDEDDGYNEPAEYAHAPCTPGLWEEPNLSNIQETSACDDHQEPENHTIPEFAVKQSIENVKEQVDNQFESDEKSPPHVVATEQMLMDDLGSTPFTESVLANHVNSISETVDPVSNDPEKVEDLLNKHVRDEEPLVQMVEGNQETASQLDRATEPILEPKDSTFPVPMSHESVPSSVFPTLRPCVTLMNHETNVEGPHANEVLNNNLQEIHPSERSLNDEVQLTSSISDRQVDNVIESAVQIGNINSNTSDMFPVPEKLLSFSQGLSDVPKHLLSESTPAANDVAISGKKRSFSETSMNAQSIDLNESWGFFNTNVTEQPPQQPPVLNDDDLLSSILVGRNTSLLKMKPTPPVSTKRRRAPKTPKTGVSKRKVVMDDNMVLHGDTIRQQLTNTDDIRRLRKKAPCTRAEISMLEKNFWEDELFGEPICTGVSFRLASLHNQTYDLSNIVVSPLEGGPDPKLISHSDEKDVEVEVETQNTGVSVGPYVPNEIGIEDKDVAETQPIELPLVTDNTSNLEYYGNQNQNQNQTPMDTAEVVAEPFSSEHPQTTPMDVDPKSFSDIVMPIEAESPSYNHNDMSAAAIGEIENTNQMDAFLQTDAHRDININNNNNIDSSMAADVIADDVIVGKVSEEKHENEIRINEEVVNEGAPLDQSTDFNAQNMIYNGIFGEDFVTSGVYDSDANAVTRDASLDERENLGQHVTFEMTEMNVEDTPANNRLDDEEFNHSAVENDTDFLNFDDVDDDGGDAGGDYGPDVETTRVIDNSGWSSRTKAVTKYLQIMFDKEAERGRNMLSVNNLLIGKTRKEASRMFFETLVLKTKDYIHVEQADPYENINVFPRAKLLKSDF
ncbi:sister chromatid cohesion 1 protein 4-like isoform X2 [Rutidosis leptorrhynchoides]|uniref:sister chromatid cohesion 1 protein 4-like isoform X2 n=1 Tax=Rutidosis leptorrhynchoides TaxID=125765 RepID=UPI003A996F83